MDHLHQSFSVRFEYKVFFTAGLFTTGNDVLKDFLYKHNQDGQRKKILFVVDSHVANAHPGLVSAIRAYFLEVDGVALIDDIIIIPGGEACKNNTASFDVVLDAVNRFGIDRHSYIAAIGGGAVLDVVGYAAAVAHRGIRHIRIPTTVLAQNDSGVGVKNSINYFNKKNFIGTFSPPVAVFNDADFLKTLSLDEWRSGIAEAVKVALIKDRTFFEWLEANATNMMQRDADVMHQQIKRCAALHLAHIASGDPFEVGSSRPLDFGHWSAHKLEQLTNFQVRHGEAVAMGMALDCVYSFLTSRLTAGELHSVINLLTALGFRVYHPLMSLEGEHRVLLDGLQEFREHLGGKLTIMLLREIGHGEEVNAIDEDKLREASAWLKSYSAQLRNLI